mgnify:CR=1 FL=1
MAFEVFDKRSAPMKGTPSVTIQKRGILSINGPAHRMIDGALVVELLFDNQDGQITGSYAAYSEISVRRELGRDAGSQYFPNGRKCLKRDVTDLFLGTGLGGGGDQVEVERAVAPSFAAYAAARSIRCHEPAGDWSSTL